MDNILEGLANGFANAIEVFLLAMFGIVDIFKSKDLSQIGAIVLSAIMGMAVTSIMYIYKEEFKDKSKPKKKRKVKKKTSNNTMSSYRKKATSNRQVLRSNNTIKKSAPRGKNKVNVVTNKNNVTKFELSKEIKTPGVRKVRKKVR